jgi:hypothetical protein
MIEPIATPTSSDRPESPPRAPDPEPRAVSSRPRSSAGESSRDRLESSPETISSARALHIIQRMGETGQPPERDALAVNVGTQGFLDVLREEYMLPIRELGRGSSFKLVQAPFGGGKTHFLHCVRECAHEIGLATALVGVSPKECPFDDAVKIYQEVARRLELPPDEPEAEPIRGLDEVLRTVAERRVEQNGELRFREWVREELARTPVESLPYRRAVILFLEAVLDRGGDREEALAGYLRGDRLGTDELSDLRLRETLEESNAFRFLRSIVQVLRALGLGGVVLLFDELDRVMSLTVKRKRVIGDNLRQLMDHCGQSTLPATLWIYAVPPEFMTNVVPEYPALEQRLRGVSLFSSFSPQQPVIDLDSIPIEPEQMFRAIGERLLALYERAHGHSFDPKLQSRNIASVGRAFAEIQLESGTRRELVKSLIALLTDQHRRGERALSREELDRFTSASLAAANQPPPLEGEEELSF